MISSLTARVADRPKLNWRQLKEFDNHEFVIALTDEASGLKAFVAIHNRNLGMAHGGTRLKPYKNDTEALADALNLSKAMSYKSALAGLPYGGAKAVISWQEGLAKPAVLKAFAQKVEALNGLFHTGTDVGLTDDDVRLMAKHSRYMLGVGPGNKHNLSTSKTAALGVFKAVQTAVAHRYGSDGLKGKTIGVKGVGKLGGELVHLLAAAGADLLIADVNHRALVPLVKAYPSIRVVPPTTIHSQVMDVFAPCALGEEFTSANWRELKCQIIAGGANNQLANDIVGDQIYKKGIIYAPDYVANAGGLIFVSEELEKDGFNYDRVLLRLEHSATTLKSIFQESDKKRLPTHRVAANMAEKRIKYAKP